MKTAMQELLDIVNKDIKNAHILKNNGLNNINDINTLLSTYNYFKIIIEKNMLEKEKDMMFHSFYAGNGYDESLGDSEIIFEEYYNETYNQNKLTIKTDGKVGLSNPDETTNNKLNINQNK